MARLVLVAFSVLLAGRGHVAAEEKLGATHGPAYYNKANLRLGGVDHITRLGEDCGFADAAYQSMAVKHVNDRDSTWCKAIENLLPVGSDYWDMSLVLMDATEQASELGTPAPRAALSAGLKLVGSTPDAPAPLLEWEGTSVPPWSESAFNGAPTDILPVHGLLGPSYSGTTMKTASFFASFDVPIMSNYATNPAMSQKSGNSAYPNFWRTCPPDSLKMDIIAAWLKSWNIPKLFVVTINDAFPKGMRDALLGYCPNHGLECQQASKLVPASTADQTDEFLNELVDEYAASGTRTIVLCGLGSQDVKIMKALVARGLANGDDGYIVVHPELIGKDLVEFDGALAVLPSHEIESAWQAAYDMAPPLTTHVKGFVNSGGFVNEPFVYTAIEQSPICGVQQDVLCNSTSIGYDGKMDPKGDPRENKSHWTWHQVKDQFDLCSAYGPLGYDSVVSYAAAFDIGLRLNQTGHPEGFDKDSVTPGKLMKMLNILTQGVDATGNAVNFSRGGTDIPVKEFYGTCVGSGGPIGFEWRDGMKQERGAHFSVVNYREEGGSLISYPTWDMYSPTPGAPVKRSDEALQTVKFGTGATPGYPRERPSFGMPPTCVPGQYLSADGCVATAPGYYQPEAGQDSQLPCPLGTHCESGGCSDQCDPCPTGEYQNETGQATCTKCAPGKFSSVPGAEECSMCQRGTFAYLEGSDSCAACPIGQVQRAMGQATCDVCPDGRTTFGRGASLLASCLCEEGSMEPNEVRRTVDSFITFVDEMFRGADDFLADVDTLDVLPTCQSCPEGFECPLGSTFYEPLGENHDLPGYQEPDPETFEIISVSRPNMAVAEGYYLAAGYKGSASSPREDLSQNIYLCDGLGIQRLTQKGYVSPCPGGPADSCGTGREGVACAVCSSGAYSSIAGPCQDCDGWEPWILVFVIVAGFIAIAASYYFINDPLNTRMSPMMVLAMCGGTFVMTMQSVAALASLQISFPDGLSGLFAGTRLFALDLRVLRPECSIGSSVMASYVLKVLLPWVLFALFTVLCLLSKVLPCERLRWEASKTFNTVCNFFQAAFITIILTVVGPFRTFSHPGSGDRSSMLSSPDIDTSSSTYAGLVALAVLGLLPCVLFIALYVVSVKQSTAWRETEMTRRLQAIKFVLFRFTKKGYYWGLCFLARSTAVSVITLLNNPFAQLLLLGVVMTVYLVALVKVWPWKAPVVNVLDALQTALLIIILLAATRLVGTDNGGGDTDGVTGLIFTCYIVLVLAFVGAGILAFLGKIDLGEGEEKGDMSADKIPDGGQNEESAADAGNVDVVEVSAEA